MTPRKVAACFALALVCAQPASATEYSLRAKDRPGQTVEYDHGYATVTSKLTDSDLSITYLGTQHGRRMAFAFTLVNHGMKDVNIDLPDIVARSETTPLHVYASDELVNKEKSRAIWEAMAVGAVQGLQDAASTQSTTVYSNGHYGAASFSTTTRIDATDPIAEEENAEQSERLISDIRAVRDGNIAVIQRDIVEITTVKPGYEFHGMIVVDPPKGDDHQVDLTINFGTDAHAFMFDTKRP